MPLTKVKFEVCGINYAVTTNESEEYTLSLAEKVEQDFNLFLAQNPAASITSAAVVTAMTYLDDINKANKSVDNMREQIHEYLEDSARAKMEAEEVRKTLATAQRIAEEAKNALADAQRENERIREIIAQREHSQRTSFNNFDNR